MNPDKQNRRPLPPDDVARVNAALQVLGDPHGPAADRSAARDAVALFLQEHLFGLAVWRANQVEGLSAGDLFQTAFLNLLQILDRPGRRMPEDVEQLRAAFRDLLFKRHMDELRRRVRHGDRAEGQGGDDAPRRDVAAPTDEADRRLRSARRLLALQEALVWLEQQHPLLAAAFKARVLSNHNVRFSEAGRSFSRVAREQVDEERTYREMGELLGCSLKEAWQRYLEAAQKIRERYPDLRDTKTEGAPVNDDPFGEMFEDVDAFLRDTASYDPGTTFGEFEILGRLGVGGEGVVYRARNAAAHDRLVALKFMTPQTAPVPEDAGVTTPDASADLLRQIRPVVTLNLANFVIVYSVRSERPARGGRRGERAVPFIEMELASGRSLDDWRGDRRLALRQVVAWLVPVARSLHSAHELDGLTHYDLKPANILLFDPQPGAEWDTLDPARLTPKVADFGLTRSADDRGVPYGTDGFAPPDQRDPERSPFRDEARRRAAATDGFALAATLVAAFDPAGRGPGPGRDGVYAVPDFAHLRLAGADADLTEVLRKQLDPDPRLRYETVGAFADDLQRWLDGEAVAARNYRGAVRKAWGKQPRRVKAGVLAALFALLAAVGAVWWQWAEKRREAEDAANARAASAEAQAVAARSDKDAADAREKAAKADLQKREADLLVAKVQTEAAEQRLKDDAAKLLTANVTAARTAARRGDWKSAMTLYAQAIRAAEQQKHPDAVRYRVERLFGYFVVADLPGVHRELTVLEAGELGPLAAQVHLVRGMQLLCDGQYDEGRQHLRTALADRGNLFSPADAAYAEALIETRPKAVIDKLREAVRSDTLYYPAQMTLTIVLLLDGNLKAAREQCALVEGLFPDAPTSRVVRGLLAAIDGKRDDMRKAIASYAEKTGRSVAALEKFGEAFVDALDVLSEFDSPLAPRLHLAAEKTDSLGKLTELWGMPVGGAPLAFPEPAIAFSAWIKDTAEWAGRASASFGNDKEFAELEQKCRESGEAIYRAAAFYNRLTLFALRHQRGTFDAGRPVLSLAAKYAHAAADAETIIPRSPLRYVMRSSGLLADIVILRFTPDPDPIHFRRVREHVHEVVAKGGAWPDAREFAVFQVVGTVFDDGAPETFFADWKRDTAEGKAALRARNRELYHVARTVLDAWAVTDDHRIDGWFTRPADCAAAVRRKLNLGALDKSLETWAGRNEVRNGVKVP